MKFLLFQVVLLSVALVEVMAGEKGKKFAYVSVLSSDDFKIAARVLNSALHEFSPHIPFLLFCTEDVTNETFTLLKTENITALRIPKYDTPYIATHKARKFQYTKMRLWCLTEYDALVHLDLDTLPLADISELFKCGDFCASIRHSDMFNTGVFVFRPSKKVCDDMLNHTAQLASYDGGDQGFLNTYFQQIKYAPMFDPNGTYQWDRVGSNEGILRLSAVYNYDIGMYYLNSRMLVEPKIIHYTLGPTKPWEWWTYPVFDLNWRWLQRRYQVHKLAEEPLFDKRFLFIELGIAVILSISYKVFCSFFLLKLDPIDLPPLWERRLLAPIAMTISFVFAIFITPLQMLPIQAWATTTLNFNLFLVLILAVYTKIRLDRNLSGINGIQIFLTICLATLLCWNVLLFIGRPGTRFLATIAEMVILALGIRNLINFLVFPRSLKHFRYLNVDTNVDKI